MKPFFLFTLTLSLVASLGSMLGSTASAQELEEQVFDIARQLRRPVSRAESAADSNANISIEFRDLIQEQLEQGKSEAEILAFFQERYGDWILLSPPKRGLHLLVWLLPIIMAIVGVIILLWFVRRSLQQAKAIPEASETDLSRVQQLLDSNSLNASLEDKKEGT